VSKERARLRAQRLAAEEKARLARERRQRLAHAVGLDRVAKLFRRTRRRTGRRPWRRRTGKIFARRNRAQRAAIAVGVGIALLLVWTLVDPLLTRIGLTVFIAVATPAVVVITLDRRI
jgi:ferric-dicitrate binding protein FerR (iron transport regulator)